MLARDITYENPFTGQAVTEKHYFHISKADLVEMEMEEHGSTYTKADGTELTGMQAKLQMIVDSEDGKAIMREFKDMIRRSYGRKDGDRFRKSQEIQDDFLASEAFSQLLFELCTKPDAAAEFINGVVPGNLDQIAAEVRAQAEKVNAGREAQAKAKAAGSGHPSDPAATPVGQLSDGTATAMEALSDAATEAKEAGFDTSAVEQPSLIERIETATADNPITLTEAEIREIDTDELKSGLVTGRIKLS